MVFLSNVSLAYEKVRLMNHWISEDILSFMCPSLPFGRGSRVEGN